MESITTPAGASKSRLLTPFNQAQRALDHIEAARAAWDKLDPTEHRKSLISSDAYEAGDEGLYHAEWAAVEKLMTAPASNGNDVAVKLDLLVAREMWLFAPFANYIAAIKADLSTLGGAA